MFYVLFHYSKGNKERDFRGFRSEDELIEFLHLEYERIDIVQIISVEKTYRLGLIETDEVAKSVLISQEIETDLPDPEEESTTMEKIIKETEEKKALKIPDEAILEPGEEKTTGFIPKPVVEEIKRGYERKKEDAGEKSAMETIADDIEKEKEEDLTEEEIIKKNKATLKKADNAIAAAKKDLEKKPERLIINPAEKPEKKPQMARVIDKTDWPKCPECGKNPMAPWNKSGRCSECQQYKKKPKKDVIDKKDWPDCPDCKIRKMAPWNTVGCCSYCQGNRGKKKK